MLTIAELYVRRELGEMLDIETEEQVHCRRGEGAVQPRDDRQIRVRQLCIGLVHGNQHLPRLDQTARQDSPRASA
jgi:hypothetical protein